jgi:hypothetical protein
MTVLPDSYRLIGRKKREERHGGGARGQSQRCGHLSRSPFQRLVQFAAFVTFRAVTNTELYSEVNTKSDEQDEEGNRKQVERSDNSKTERSRDGKANHHTEIDRNDNLPGTKRQP